MKGRNILKRIGFNFAPDYRLTKIGFAVLGISCLVIGTCLLYAGPYTDSAHGNSSYGVNRSSIASFNYSRGNCSHCHEQHGSIGGSEPEPVSGYVSARLLFRTSYDDQSNGFCYRCHQTNSIQTGMPAQYCYSYRWGGDTSISCPDSIRDAFVFINEDGTHNPNCSSSTGSSHQLTVIRNFIRNKWGFGSNVLNPCSACHNSHKAQRSNYPIGVKGTSSFSRPSSHANNWELWGDDTAERMSNYSSNYQAPYYYNSTMTYEPNGDATSDGSNMPDYVTFCTDCHNPSYDGQVSSAQKYNFTGNWQAILFNPDWENTSPHGKIDGMKPDSTNRKAPYTANRNYVLSCTDCHEPHGSSNGMLIRKEVNGSSTVTFTSWANRDDWLTLCLRCHQDISGHSSGSKGSDPCYVCHMHNKNWFKPF